MARRAHFRRWLTGFFFLAGCGLAPSHAWAAGHGEVQDEAAAENVASRGASEKSPLDGLFTSGQLALLEKLKTKTEVLDDTQLKELRDTLAIASASQGLAPEQSEEIERLAKMLTERQVAQTKSESAPAGISRWSEKQKGLLEKLSTLKQNLLPGEPAIPPLHSVAPAGISTSEISPAPPNSAPASSSGVRVEFADPGLPSAGPFELGPPKPAIVVSPPADPVAIPGPAEVPTQNFSLSEAYNPPSEWRPPQTVAADSDSPPSHDPSNSVPANDLEKVLARASGEIF